MVVDQRLVQAGQDRDLTRCPLGRQFFKSRFFNDIEYSQAERKRLFNWLNQATLKEDGRPLGEYQA